MYRALYDYEPRDSGELAIAEGDLLYVLEKGDDDGWWKAKKKAGDEEDEEPTGLVPQNYVEEVWRSQHSPAKASLLLQPPFHPHDDLTTQSGFSTK